MFRLRHAASVLLPLSLAAAAHAVADPPSAVPVPLDATATPAPPPHSAPADSSARPDDDAPAPAVDERPAEATGATSTPQPADSTGPDVVVPVVPAGTSALTPEPLEDPDGTATTVDADATVLTTDEAASTSPPVVRPLPKAHPAGVTFSGIPAVNYISDNGVGFGAIVAAYFHDGVTAPYRTALTLQLFVTTNLVQDHNLIVDSLRLFDQPLRLNARVGYLSSLTQPYCGVGGTVSCDPAVAIAAARERGLVDDETEDDSYDRFVRNFYQRRFMSPYGLVNFRYALVERGPGQPMRVEATAGYRAFYFIPGNIFADDDNDGSPDLTPYAGSLFAQDHPDGQPGLSSVVTAGLMLDSRDNEPNPTEGWWIEGSVRATTPGLSTWNYAGFNVTLRGYTHLPVFDLGRRLVLANRFTVDGLVGDVPIQEMARLGGSQDFYTFGGADTGRGIRVQRYLGKARVIDMAELRWRFAEVSLFEQAFAFSAVAFADVAIIGDELYKPKDLGVVGGTGGALRIAWNENFIVRFDLGVSPFENWAPQPYITVNQPF